MLRQIVRHKNKPGQMNPTNHTLQNYIIDVVFRNRLATLLYEMQAQALRRLST